MSNRFQPKIGHSQANNNSENTHWGRHYTNINVLTDTSSVYYTGVLISP